jgi:bifunctional NMN adenylyltransferase/nudix hydrolase
MPLNSGYSPIMHQYDIGLIIGRFSPPHLSHIKLFDLALASAKRIVIVIGSASNVRSQKNPWISEERTKMIRLCLSEAENIRTTIIPIVDQNNDAIWKQQILTALNIQMKERTILIGCKKDVSSYYLDLFPEFSFIEAELIEGVSSSNIREQYFAGANGWKKNLHSKVIEFLIEWEKKAV